MTVERPVEIELKYAVADRTIGERLLNAETLAGFRAMGAPRPTQHEDRYVDSADGALARAGFAARLRTAANDTIVSVKSTGGGDGSLHQREELEGPADRTSDVAGWPPSAARSLILELCGDAPLVELVTIRQFRRRRDLELPDGESAVELSLDEVDVVARGRVVERFLELELELKRGSLASLAPLQALLDGHHGLSPSAGSKLDRALLAASRTAGRRPSTPRRTVTEPAETTARATPPTEPAATGSEVAIDTEPAREPETPPDDLVLDDDEAETEADEAVHAEDLGTDLGTDTDLPLGALDAGPDVAVESERPAPLPGRRRRQSGNRRRTGRSRAGSSTSRRSRTPRSSSPRPRRSSRSSSAARWPSRRPASSRSARRPGSPATTSMPRRGARSSASTSPG